MNKEAKIYRFDTSDKLEELIAEWKSTEKMAFPFFDDNGGQPDGNALLLEEQAVEADPTLRDLVKKYNIKKCPGVVFDNEEDADEQAFDGGIKCYYTASERYLVLI